LLLKFDRAIRKKEGNASQNINDKENNCMNKKIYIGNCDFKLEEPQLESFLSEQGVQTSSVQIIRDRFTQRSKGFAFAELNEGQDIEAAIQALNGKELNGRKLNVNEAREREKAPRGDFGGNRGQGGDRGGRNFGGGDGSRREGGGSGGYGGGRGRR
jgi:RNA recognition motif-containing protein